MKYEDDDPPGMIPLPFGCFCADMYVSTYCTIMHLSLLAPGLGFILILILWFSNKDRNSTVDRHGRTAINWMLSCSLYFIVTLLLMIYYRPVVHILPILTVLYYIFPIIAAVRANDGRLWKYPLSIPFFKV